MTNTKLFSNRSHRHHQSDQYLRAMIRTHRLISTFDRQAPLAGHSAHAR